MAHSVIIIRMVKISQLLILALLALVFITTTREANAQANNIYGIHIIDENDLENAAALVNSGGGEWGYVTVVIREDQRETEKWQRVFDKMRRLKLIPIVRIATTMDGGNWIAPSKNQAADWATFLDTLNWPVKKRILVIFNEPNHAKEWGGLIDPEGYTDIYKHYYKTLKDTSSDFYILAAALDLAAPNSAKTMEAKTFFNRMHDRDNYIFTLYDGLNSHSYPNPGFIGDPKDQGRMSIKGYKWELETLSKMGLNPESEVYITETGWLNSATNLIEKYEYAFKDAWQDPQIKAVTPFVLNYLEEPFADFSWTNPATREFLPHYLSVQSYQKIKGGPEQISSLDILGHNFANYLVTDSEYSFFVEIKNTGQSIWSESDGFEFKKETSMDENNITIEPLLNVEPGQSTKVYVRLNTNEPRGIHSIKLVFYAKDKIIKEVLDIKFTLISPPSLDVSARFWFGRQNNNSADLEIYDGGSLINRYENIRFIDGKAHIPAIRNVIPNHDYSFVIKKPYFLNAIRKATLYAGNVKINFGRLIPIDFNKDGNLNLKDLLAYIINPLKNQIIIFSL